MNDVAQPSADQTIDLMEKLKDLKIDYVKQQLADEGIEDIELLHQCTPEDVKQLVDKLKFQTFGDKLKFRECLQSVSIPKQQIHFLTKDEQEIMNKLYERYSDISEDINCVQTAENEFNESVVAAKKMVNERVNYILDEVSKKKKELLKQIDDIHNENKKIFAAHMSNLEKVSKVSLKNKEKFNVVATSNDLSPSQKTKALKKLLAIDDDQKKNDGDINYDNFKIIGDQCVISGKVSANFNKQSLDTFLESFMNIECAKNTSKWKTKRYYDINWDDVKQLDLRNGTGGKSGEKPYTVNNVCVVEASHPVWNNSYENYYMPYMFNQNVSKGLNYRNIWLTKGPKKQTLIFTFNEAIQLSFINVYANNGWDDRCKYGIDLYYDDKWNVLCDLIDASKDVDGVPRKHVIQKEVKKVRFNFEIVQSCISMKEIDFFVAKET